MIKDREWERLKSNILKSLSCSLWQTHSQSSRHTHIYTLHVKVWDNLEREAE